MDHLKVAWYLAATAGEQALEGTSIEAQRATLGAHCRVQGWQTEGVYVDLARRGEVLSREGLDSALASIGNGRASALLVVGLDRLAGSVAGLGALLERVEAGGFPLVSLAEALNTASPAGRHAADVLVCVGRWPRRERTASSCSARRRSRNCWQTGRMLPGACPRR